jgi:hypothetical protein
MRMNVLGHYILNADMYQSMQAEAEEYIPMYSSVTFGAQVEIQLFPLWYYKGVVYQKISPIVLVIRY